MKISICITNNNNNNQLIQQTIDILQYQYQKPQYIFVCSDGGSFNSEELNVINVNKKNLVNELLCSASDAFIFIDGDSYPKDKDFIIKYEDNFDEYDLIFGTKEHTDPKTLKHPPMDFLIGNIENLWKKSNFDYTDIREKNNSIELWKDTKNFNERLDMVLDGQISQCNNFGITKSALRKLLKFNEYHHGRKELFDSKATSFKDIAFGLNALYAGMKIGIENNITIVHKSHESPNENISNHLIMEYYRKLESSTKIKNKVYNSIIILFGTYILGIITGLVTMAITSLPQ